MWKIVNSFDELSIAYCFKRLNMFLLFGHMFKLIVGIFTFNAFSIFSSTLYKFFDASILNFGDSFISNNFIKDLIDSIVGWIFWDVTIVCVVRSIVKFPIFNFPSLILFSIILYKKSCFWGQFAFFSQVQIRSNSLKAKKPP